MQRSDLRTLLRAWLLDTVEVQWSDTRIDRYVNLALIETEKHILAVDPEAFKCTYTAATTVADTGKDNIYSYPAGTFAVHEVALSSDGTSYVPLQRLSLRNAREAQASGASLSGFIPWDAHHFMLWPSASSVVSAGLRVTVAPVLVLADDSQQNPLPIPFETLLMKHTQKMCLFDVGESLDEVNKEIREIEERTPRFYLTASEPAFIVPVIPGGRYSG